MKLLRIRLSREICNSHNPNNPLGNTYYAKRHQLGLRPSCSFLRYTNVLSNKNKKQAPAEGAEGAFGRRLLKVLCKFYFLFDHAGMYLEMTGVKFYVFCPINIAKIFLK